jgi:hypothetical protein
MNSVLGVEITICSFYAKLLRVPFFQRTSLEAGASDMRAGLNFTAFSYSLTRGSLLPISGLYL